MEKGYIQIYTGDGKGKTTAALGLGLRAAGRGLKVVMYQFLKGSFSGELQAVKRLYPDFKIYRTAESEQFFWQLNEKEKEDLRRNIQRAMPEIEQYVAGQDCDLLILDEAMSAINHGMLTLAEVFHLIETKAESVELVLTGRDVPAELLHRADLITEMKQVKHYYEEGVTARKGIEK